MVSGNLQDAMDMLKSQYEKFASGNSDDDAFKEYVSENAKELFSNIQGYWKELIER